MSKTYTFKCDRHAKCGFVTHGLNDYLAHLCCRYCGYTAVYQSIVKDSSWDLRRHMTNKHPATMAYNHWHLVVTINGFRSKGEHDKAAQLMEVYSLTEQDVARQNLNTLNEMAESLVKEGRKDDAAKVRAYIAAKAVELST